MTYREKSWKWLKIKWDSKNCSHLASGAVRCQSRPGQSGRRGCVRRHRPRWFVFDMEMHEGFKVASEDMRHAYGVCRVGSIGPSQRLTYPALLGQNTRLCFRVRQLWVVAQAGLVCVSQLLGFDERASSCVIGVTVDTVCLAWLSTCGVQVSPLSSQITTFFTKSWPWCHDVFTICPAVVLHRSWQRGRPVCDLLVEFKSCSHLLAVHALWHAAFKSFKVTLLIGRICVLTLKGNEVTLSSHGVCRSSGNDVLKQKPVSGYRQCPAHHYVVKLVHEVTMCSHSLRVPGASECPSLRVSPLLNKKKKEKKKSTLCVGPGVSAPSCAFFTL